MFRICTAVVAAAILVPAPVHAQTPELCSPLDQYVKPFQTLDVFSGVVLVARGDSILCERPYGTSNHEFGIAVQTNHVFRIASISKAFTRAVVGRLMDQNKLALDDVVGKWLPDFPSADRITVRMLLDHGAGVPNINSIPFDEEALAPNSLAALVDSIAKRPLDFAPGSKRAYSNGGYAVLARIIELIEKRPFDVVLSSELLVPLGLQHTQHERDGQIIPRIANGYMPSSLEFGVMVRAPFQEMATKTGGGSMVSTARDLLAWSKAIGTHPVLRPATWKELFPDRDVRAFQGRAPGFNALLVDDRVAGTVVIVLANNYSASMVGDIADAALKLARNQTPAMSPVTAAVTAPRAGLQRETGSYMPPPESIPAPADTPIEIRLVGESLVAFISGVPVDVLVPQGERRFLARAFWSLIEFSGTDTRAAAMKVRALYRDAEYTAPRVH